MKCHPRKLKGAKFQRKNIYVAQLEDGHARRTARPLSNIIIIHLIFLDFRDNKPPALSELWVTVFCTRSSIYAPLSDIIQSGGH